VSETRHGDDCAEYVVGRCLFDAARSGPASGGLDELDDVIHALEGGDITGGLLAVRVLRERLAATEPVAADLRFDPSTYDARRAEVAEMIDQADRQDDVPMGPDGLADALMEIAEGWVRAALSTEREEPPA
jgi:hypothetical protein